MIRWAGWASAAGLAALGVTALHPVDDPDFWWLLRGGRYMVETGSFPTTDPFSATARGAEWLNHAWAFELLLYGVHALAGIAGIVALQGVFAGASFAVIHALLRREGLGRGWALGVTALGALATWGFWAPRPQLVTYLLLAVFSAVLSDFQAGRANRLRWLPPLAVLWVNFHGGFLAGPALIALCAGAEVADRALGGRSPGGGHGQRARALALCCGATLAASLLNPFHYRALLFPLHVVADPVSKLWIAEWTSPAFGHPQLLILEGLLLLVLLLALRAERPVRWRDLAVLLPLVHLGFQATRNTPILVIGAMPIVARAAVAWGPPRWGALTAPARIGAAAGAAALLVLGLALAVGEAHPRRIWSALPPRSGVTERFPEAAVAFLRASGGSGTLLNEYEWGGYLVWHLYPAYRVSIDGRMAVYGPERFKEHVTVTELRPGWRETLDHLAPAVAIVRTESALGRMLRVEGWTVLHEDRVGTVLRPPGRS